MESSQSVPPFEYLKRTKDHSGQFEYVGEQIEHSHAEHRLAKIEMHGGSFIMPNGTRRIQLSDAFRTTLERSPDSNGDLVPQMLDTSHTRFHTIPADHVLIIANAGNSTEAVVLFFDDPD